MRIIAIFVEMSANSEMNKINEETPITSFTLNDLLSMSGSRSRLGLMSSCLAANSASVMQTFRYPCRIDAFIIGVGTEGEATVSFNLREYKLQKDTLFVSTPKNIVQVHSSGHFRCHIVHVSPGLLEQISVDTKRMMPLFLKIAMHPCLGLTPEEARTVREFISLIERVTDGPETPFGMEVVGGADRRHDLQGRDILAHYLAEHPEVENPVHSRAEGISGSSCSCSANTTGGAQRRILCPEALHHAQVPHDAHQADQRQIRLGMDRQLRDPRGQDAAQILEHERTGDLLLSEFFRTSPSSAAISNAIPACRLRSTRR